MKADVAEFIESIIGQTVVIEAKRGDDGILIELRELTGEVIGTVGIPTLVLNMLKRFRHLIKTTLRKEGSNG